MLHYAFIISSVGCPSRDKLNFVESSAGIIFIAGVVKLVIHVFYLWKLALQRILKYEGRRAPPFGSLFPPGSNPEALDLLYRMLQFHPDDRLMILSSMAFVITGAFHVLIYPSEYPSQMLWLIHICEISMDRYSIWLVFGAVAYWIWKMHEPCSDLLFDFDFEKGGMSAGIVIYQYIWSGLIIYNQI